MEGSDEKWRRKNRNATKQFKGIVNLVLNCWPLGRRSFDANSRATHHTHTQPWTDMPHIKCIFFLLFFYSSWILWPVNIVPSHNLTHNLLPYFIGCISFIDAFARVRLNSNRKPDNIVAAHCARWMMFFIFYFGIRGLRLHQLCVCVCVCLFENCRHFFLKCQLQRLPRHGIFRFLASTERIDAFAGASSSRPNVIFRENAKAEREITQWRAIHCSTSRRRSIFNLNFNWFSSRV